MITGEGPGRGSKSLPGIGVAQGDTLEQSVDNAVEVLLYASGVVAGTGDYAAKASHIRAAMLASAVAVPASRAGLNH